MSCLSIFKLKPLGFITSLILFSQCLYAEGLAVIYPEIREPYRQIFLNIYQGIETNYDGSVSAYILEKDSKPEALFSWVNTHKINGIIVLGNRSMRAILSLPSSSLTYKPLTIVGAVLIQPDSAKLSAITLVPEPSVIFKQLINVLPKAKHVHVVYRQENTWFIEAAIKKAANHGIKILGRKAENTREMAYLYRQILSQMDPKRDALWIAPYGRSPDKTVLKVILQEAWENKLPVISSSLADVKRGALFSFYTNNIEMGQELVAFWKSEQKNVSKKFNVLPTKSVEIAVNLRTADHLDLYYSKKDRLEFGLMYPVPLDR